MWPPDKLRAIRLAELERVLPYFPAGCRVLEIGAGAGWQALELDRKGFEVEAIEYAHTGFRALAEQRVWNVIEYDGAHIPFPDNSFDIVFSSNVLEHIPHVRAFQDEIRRVLKPDGIAVHLMPTASWRIWSTFAHYLFVAQRLFPRLLPSARRRRPSRRPSDADVPSRARAARRSLHHRLAWLMIPKRHGEFGNFMTEIAYFSRWKWRHVFRDAGFRIESEGSNGVFYTGYGILADHAPVSVRKSLSRLLGGSCRYWVLRQQPRQDRA